MRSGKSGLCIYEVTLTIVHCFTVLLRIYVPSFLLRRRRLFPESKILHWFVQIALGLHYMHDRLVLHRDLKTQNIFLLGNGRLVLGDLGISKVSIYK